MAAIASNGYWVLFLLTVEGSDFIVLMRSLEFLKICGLVSFHFRVTRTLADLPKTAVSPKAVSPKAGRYLNQCGLSEEGEQPDDVNGGDLSGPPKRGISRQLK